MQLQATEIFSQVQASRYTETVIIRLTNAIGAVALLWRAWNPFKS